MNPRHPLTGIPAVYVNRNGRAFYPIAGGAPDDPAPAPADPAPAPTPDPAPADPAPAPTPAPTPNEPKSVEELPAWAQKQIKDLRTENGNTRTAKTEAENQRQAMLDGIAKALGIKPEDTPPDPADLQRTLSEREGVVTNLQQDMKARDIELAAWREAVKPQHNANVLALMDSRSFLTALSSLDPAAEDFSTKLEATVKKAVEDNPTLRAVASAGQAGIGAAGSGTVSIADAPARDLLRAGYAASKQ